MKACVPFLTLVLCACTLGTIPDVCADPVPTLDAAVTNVDFERAGTGFGIYGQLFGLFGEDPLAAREGLDAYFNPGQPIGTYGARLFNFSGPTPFYPAMGTNIPPFGDITVNGVPYFATRFAVGGQVNVSPLVMAPVIVQGESASVTVAATVAGGGAPCISITLGKYLCDNYPYTAPDPIANIAFDLPGEFTLNFVCCSFGQELLESAIFTSTPVPEPSSVILLLLGVGLFLVWRFHPKSPRLPLRNRRA